MDVNCNNCQHKTICKWCPEMDLTHLEVYKLIDGKKPTPIKISITCCEYLKQNQGQDICSSGMTSPGIINDIERIRRSY